MEALCWEKDDSEALPADGISLTSQAVSKAQPVLQKGAKCFPSNRTLLLQPSTHGLAPAQQEGNAVFGQNSPHAEESASSSFMIAYRLF